MPDDRTQDALDALADLFLTGLEPAAAAPTPAPRPRSAAAPAPTPPAPARTPAPAPPYPGALLDGPEPIRLGPTLRPARPAAFQPDRGQPTAPTVPFRDPAFLDDDDFTQADARSHAGVMQDGGIVEVPGDAAAETPYLRLRRDDADDTPAADEPVAPVGRDRTPAAAAPPRPRPAAPPADRSARDVRGPAPEPAPVLVEAVLLGNLPGIGGAWLTQYARFLALQDGPVALLHVDDAGVDLEIVDPAGADARNPAESANDLVHLLTSLIHAETNPLRTILVHHDAAPEPAGLARLLALDQWTFLCGADDMAVVGVYRALKQLIEAAPAEAHAQDKQVALMIMGSEPAAGRAAARRVQSAAASYLKTPIQLVGCQKRMQPVRVWQGGSFDGLETLWPRLETLFQTFDRPKAADLEPAPLPPITPARGLEVDADARVEPAAAPAPSASAAADIADDPDLLQLIAPAAVPGGVALQARCPRHPHTQFALDQRGRLHLLRRHTTDASDSAAPPDLQSLQAAALDLLEARNWVREHLQLLALTQRQLRFDDCAPPALHLFTPRADLATRLAARLEETLHLHLLSQVRVADQATWFCTPLS